MISRQRGTTVVEFAVIGLLFFMILFGVFEASRMMFARGVLEEGVRRGARLAAVCPLNDPAVLAAASFAAGGSSTLLGNFGPSNMRVEYLNAAGTLIGDPVANYAQIRFVRVAVQNFSMPLLIPGLNHVFQPTNVSSTIPAESLGVSATAVTPC